MPQNQNDNMMTDLQGNRVPIPAGATLGSPVAASDDGMMTDLQGNRVPIPQGATLGSPMPHPGSTSLPSAASPIAPPPIARPNVPMSNSTLGTIYSRLAHGPDGAIVNPKLAAARDFAASMEREANNPSPMTQIGTGALASGLQTVHTAARIANAVTGDNVSGLPTTFKEPEQLETHGFYEGAGSVAEQLAEFAMGEGEAKAGAKVLAEHYGQVAKLAKVIEETPLLQKALRIARTSAISAAQSGAHGQDVAQGAEYGAAGGVVGELAGSAAGQLIKNTPAAVAEATTAKFNDDLAKELSDNTVLKNQLSNEVSNAYDHLQAKFGKPAGDTLARRLDQPILSYGDLAADLRTQAKPVFEQLDKESEGAFQATKNKIEAARKIIRNPASPEAFESAQKSEADGEKQLASIFDNSSLDPKDLDSARSMWRISSTADKLDSEFDKALSVPQKGHSALPPGTNVTVDPKKLVARLNRAVDSIPKNRMAELIGEDGTKKLYGIIQPLAGAMADEKKAAQLSKMIAEAQAKLPKPSPGNTIGYGLLSSVSGAGVGAGVGAGAGAVNARVHGEDVTSGAAQGALYGAAAGGVAGLGYAPFHFMLTHPDIGAKMLAVVNKAAPLGSQAIKSATHVFNPATNAVEPAGNSD